MPVTAVSLFSGCGGFDLGATRAGVQILWANDIYSPAAATYQKYFSDTEFRKGDIRKINKKDIPEADLLIGCYPCQGFSNAAWRRWRNREQRDLFANPDNYLFQEFMRAVPYVRPKFIFIENVSGLRSSAHGHFFRAQQEMLESMNYNVFVRQLNAKDYGAAQSRKRIFIVGVRQDLEYEYIFPEPTHGPNRLYPYTTQWDVLKRSPLWPKGEYEEAPYHGHYLTRQRKRAWYKCSYTIVANSHHVPLHPMGEPMKKIGKDNWILQGFMNRRLSWQECALLQSFEENWEPEGGLTAKYKQIGNAVPPIFGELIVRPAVEYLEQR